MEKASWILGGKLGEGVSSHVYKVMNVKDGKWYAVKLSKGQKLIKTLKREAEILSSINNPNVITYIDSFYCKVNGKSLFEEDENEGDSDQSFALVLEACGKDFEKIFITGLVSRELALKIFKGVGLGCSYLNDNGIIHGDIKLANMIVCNEGAKITDLGLYRRIGQTYKSFSGTPFYMAPEIWTGKNYTVLTDAWAFGVAMYKALFGKFPFNAMKKTDPRYPTLTPEELKFGGISRCIVSDPVVFPFNPFSESLKTLLELLLQKDPAKRITIGEALKNPFFA